MIEEMEEVDGRTNQTIFMITGNFLLFVHVCFDILTQGIAVYYIVVESFFLRVVIYILLFVYIFNLKDLHNHTHF